MNEGKGLLLAIQESDGGARIHVIAGADSNCHLEEFATQLQWIVDEKQLHLLLKKWSFNEKHLGANPLCMFCWPHFLTGH